MEVDDDIDCVVDIEFEVEFFVFNMLKMMSLSLILLILC